MKSALLWNYCKKLDIEMSFYFVCKPKHMIQYLQFMSVQSIGITND